MAAAGSRDASPSAHSITFHATESDPLLDSSSRAQRPEPPEKRWYRARPLWLVPFVITAALCRAMTLAPRADAFIELACEELWISRHHHSRNQHTHASLRTNFSSTAFPIYSDADGSIPFIPNYPWLVSVSSAEPPPLHSTSTFSDNIPVNDDTPINCLAEPSVQAGAARLQTIMTTTMGLLSAITTGWWGQFGDRHGRTKVMMSAVSGLLFTDVMFIIASNPPVWLRGKAQQLLILASVVEGLLGGWSTLQGAIYAYISDCTSHGSRASIYTRFSGVSYVGFAFGPEIAALILRNTQTTTPVFLVSSVCASINIFLLLFVFPESLNGEIQARNIEAAKEARTRALQGSNGKTGLWRSLKVSVKAFIEPLRILGPKPRLHGRSQDWSLTFLAISLFAFFLAFGLFQIKYLYAKHVYLWDAEMLSYYITGIGTTRAVYLLIILPACIRAFKPASSFDRAVVKAKQPANPSPMGLRSEIKFDLVVAKMSTALDLLSQVLVVRAATSSENLFVGFSMISSFGSGMQPAVQSMALCMLHLREITEGRETGESKGGKEIGKLFGALAVLQAVGSMILSPLLFGLVYSLTVAAYPKAIFVVAGALMVVSLAVLFLVRPPRVNTPIEIQVETRVEVDVERSRGRSRKSKDIRSSIR